MTEPVILYGTQSNGETLPVQVDATGRLVAEGLQGQQGEQGPEGPQGPQGEKGDPGEPGEGVPTPYGPEGTYLRIRDGVPAWADADYPTAQIALTQDIDPDPRGNRQWVDDAGAVVAAPDDYNLWFKSQSFWPDGVNAPQGLGTVQNTCFDYFTFDIYGAAAKIIELKIYVKLVATTSSVSWMVTGSTDHPGLSGVVTTVASTTSRFTSYEGWLTLSWSCSSNEVPGAKITLTSSIDNAQPSECFFYMNGYRLVDPAVMSYKTVAQVQNERSINESRINAIEREINS